MSPMIIIFYLQVVDEGYNPAYGARPLRRAIMRLLEDSLRQVLIIIIIYNFLLFQSFNH